jgi:murein DD-endopeptidase MepM/ murein hydrolase activator NlpD
LADQKKLVDIQAKEKSDLLAQTKNEEAIYRAEVEARKKQVDALNAEIFEYESKLKFTLDSKSLPGKGALAWPLDSVLITQKFGKTQSSKRLYVSGSHSGVDFRAAVGTPVYAAADGTVEGVGDTDKTCYKASFGKWVFIRHTNGLATAYGHLSVIKAYEGQVVKTGDLIGYSGNTGHSTAPHLHITVFASNGIDGEEGARIADRPSTNSACKGRVYRMPIAPTSAYLDPELYLPKTTSSMYKDGGGHAGE